MRLASTLIFLLVIASLPLASSTSGRSIEVDISIMKYDWLSNETVEFSIEVSNAPFNQQFIAQQFVLRKFNILHSLNKRTVDINPEQEKLSRNMKKFEKRMDKKDRKLLEKIVSKYDPND